MLAHPYHVPTRCLLDQASTSADQLAAKANADRVKALAEYDFDGAAHAKKLLAAKDELVAAEAGQEGSKGDYGAQTKAAQRDAAAGMDWVHRLQQRVRLYISRNGDSDDLAGQFRFGMLRRARARGVRNELRMLLPEAKLQAAKLKSAGVTAAFLAEGDKLLAALGGPQAATGTLQAQKQQTEAVAAAALKVTRLLDELVQVDATYAMDHPEHEPVFRVDLVRTELARQQAVREAKLAANKGQGDGHDDEDETPK